MSDQHVLPEPVRRRISCFDALLREWLEDPETMLIAGRWKDGVVAELFPGGNAKLTGEAYQGAHSGLRDLTIAGTRHHLHLDLARFERAVYHVRPSVCYGWRPSFEVVLEGADGDSGFALSAGHTWAGERLRPAPVRRFVERLVEQRRAFGDLIGVHVRASRAPVQEVSESWRSIADVLWSTGVGEGATPFDAVDPIGSVRTVLETVVAESVHVG